MGPFFVFLSRTGLMHVECIDFPTMEQAQAFYYGIREMIYRNSRDKESGRSPRYESTDKIVWISCMMNDIMDDDGIGHFTIYSDTIRKWHIEAAIKNYLANNDI
jgi:hypothetical protein